MINIIYIGHHFVMLPTIFIYYHINLHKKLKNIVILLRLAMTLTMFANQANITP